MTTTRPNTTASVRRRRPLRLGSRGLLCAPIALSLSLPGAALAGGGDHDERGACGEAIEIFIDDRPAPRCASLLGDADVRDDNESWRTGRIMAVESGSRTLDVVHTDAQLRRPEVRALSGMIVRETLLAEVVEGRCDDDEPVDADELGDAGVEDLDGGVAFDEDDAGPSPLADAVLERVARVSLSERWAELCGQDTVVLRVDDALGARGRVLHVDRRGVLAHLGGRLVWLSRSGSEAPVFRTTWRSGFSVVTDAVSKPAPKKKATKRRPKRRSKRRR